MCLWERGYVGVGAALLRLVQDELERKLRGGRADVVASLVHDSHRFTFEHRSTTLLSSFLGAPVRVYVSLHLLLFS